jgi:benzil reductase ((S)-benzoin forming)
MLKLIIITGTSKGLGRALADILSEDDKSTVIEMGRGLSGKNARNILIEADFTDLPSIDGAFAQLDERISKLSHPAFECAILINNAGVVLPVDRFDRLDTAALNNNITVNLIAPLATSRSFIALTQGRAASRMIINISSGAAKRAVRGWTSYCAAKAGLEMATRVMAEEAREFDPTLTICSLAPGVVDTPMQAAIRNAGQDAFPEVARFRDMKEKGILRDAHAVAQDIISLLTPPGRALLQNGGNHDIRDLIHA